MKQYLLYGMTLMFALAGCSTEMADETEVRTATVSESTALGDPPFNCVGRCVYWYRACVASGESPTSCRLDREACKAECDLHSCEPGDPDCGPRTFE